jgi:sirohydrochlorin cobaltochelatase
MPLAAARVTFKMLEARLRTILPENYRDRYDEVQPVSMGSAGLKYGSDGRVAWHEMWASFCDLAMAGGPPHRGTLLEAGTEAEIAAEPLRYARVVEEICRGIGLVFGLTAEQSPTAGWVRLNCPNWGMAEWLVRAIAMENVSVRCCEGATIDLPAGPGYRVEKEIKNVITAMAKTCHYWSDHMPGPQRRAIADLFERMERESPLIQAGVVSDGAQHAAMAEAIRRATGLGCSEDAYRGWLGVVCADVRAAIWMMRLLVASNVVSRREGTVVFLPVDPVGDPEGTVVVGRFAKVHGFAVARGMV